MELDPDNEEFYRDNPDALKALGSYALYKQVTEPPHSIKGWEQFVETRSIQDE